LHLDAATSTEQVLALETDACTTETISRIESIDFNGNSFIPSYSSGWVVYIQNGHLESKTGSFSSFSQQICKLEIQPAASWLLDEIAKFAQVWSLPLVMVRCQKIIELCLANLMFPFKTSHIIECIFNQDQIFAIMKRPGQLFRNGTKGMEYAAKTIQFHYNQYQTRFLFSLTSRVERRKQELNFRAKRLMKEFIIAYRARKEFFKAVTVFV
jgi:hypothetical protein